MPLNNKKKCAECNSDSFELSGNTLYRGKINKSGAFVAYKLVDNEYIDLICSICGAPVELNQVSDIELNI